MDGKSPTVLCVGYANWDVVLTVDSLPDTDHSSSLTDRKETLGGSAANTALGIETLGTETGLLSRIGTDLNGTRVKETLSEYGVDSILKETKAPTNTVYCIVSSGKDPQYLVDLHDHANITWTDIPDEMWYNIEHVHVTSFDSELAGAIATKASNAGKTVSFNPTQDYEDKTFTDTVTAADLIILNDTEYEYFSTRYDVSHVIKSGTVLVQTHGSDGATVRTPTMELTHSGFPVSAEDVVDPVGAGDSFVAGLLDAWVSSTVYPNREQETPPQTPTSTWENLLAMGNAAGASAVRSDGAPTGLNSQTLRDIVTGNTSVVESR